MNYQKTQFEISFSTLFKIALFVVGIYLLFLLKNIILIFTVSLFLATLFAPAVDFLERKKFPRALATFLVFVVFLGFFGGIFVGIFPILKKEISGFLTDFPSFFENLNKFLKSILPIEEINLYTLGKEASSYLPNLFATTFKIIGGFFSLIIILVLAFYMVVEQKSLEGALNFFLPPQKTKKILQVYKKVKKGISRWFLGQLFLCFVIFALIFSVLLILKVEYAFLLALIAGILEIIPYLGPIFAGILIVLVALGDSFSKALWVLLAVYLIQQVENHILVPKIMQHFLGLSPVVVILALSAGATLFGFWGILLAVPFAATISIILKEIRS